MKMPECTTKGCRKPATWEIELRGEGAVYCLLYACDEHCPVELHPSDEVRRLVEE